jgi:phosphoribosylaminoimidazolecarboxamide formyltransferase/IMP cyclohydrolase
MLIDEFDEAAAAIIKHTNPCGCAIGRDLFDAYESALATDTNSAFGGILAFNREVDIRLAEKLNEMFTEVIIAPSFADDAMDILRRKRDRRLVRHRRPARRMPRIHIKSAGNGYLCQIADIAEDDPATWKVVTKRPPGEAEEAALRFAWKVARHVKSNAIVYTDERRTLGIGAGQMSRVDSSTLAVLKANAAGLSLAGSAMASDAFFPFADGLLEAVRAGATAVIQPGGSVRDEEVIAAADAHDIAMIFTGTRHFKH